MYFSVFGLLLGLFNGMRAIAEKCDDRYCYNIVRQVLMNNTKEILDICQSTSPPSQLLSIFDSDIQNSVENFFVTASGRERSTIVLALQKNANGEWIWISTSTSASQSFTNWKDGNPVLFQESDCAFFTPEESSKWWNSLCSAKIVTVVCMRAQNSQAFITNSPQTPRTTKGQTTTTAKLTQPTFWTPAVSTTTTLIPTTTATSTTIQLTTTTTTTSTTPATSTFTTTSTTSATTTVPTTTNGRLPQPSTTTTISTTPATSTFTTTSTTSATATVPTTTNGRLPQQSTATSLSSSSTRITSSSTSSGPVDPGNIYEKNVTDLSEGEKLKKNLGIGLGVSLSLVFIICLIAILVTHFFNKKNRKNSKFSSVVDIDHVKHYMAQSPQIIPPDVVSDLGNAEDRRSSDSGFDLNEDTKTKTVEHVENIDTHSVLNDDDEEVERPESTNSVHSVWPIDTSAESGLDEPEEPRFDSDYATNTGASKKSFKKVSFDLEHVVEIPN